MTYSPEGSKVAVTAALDGDDVRISVADNGIGIAGPELERIFERFYRVDPARARATGGTGLGLSIVKHVAASNGGSVDVWSEPGAGSTFTLVLPASSTTSMRRSRDTCWAVEDDQPRASRRPARGSFTSRSPRRDPGRPDREFERNGARHRAAST